MTNSPSPLQDLVALAGFSYLDCDVPAGMRLDEWHIARNRARRAARAAARRERRRALLPGCLR